MSRGNELARIRGVNTSWREYDVDAVVTQFGRGSDAVVTQFGRGCDEVCDAVKWFA